MTDPISLEDFEAEALGFLSANANLRTAEKTGWGEGSDVAGLFAEQSREDELAELAEGKAWKQKEFDAGFGWITGPVEYGGRGLPAPYQRRYQELASKFALPSTGAFGIGLGMVAPTILAHGTDRARDLYLRRLWRGEIVACQLFSEPGAGSDLAGLSTKAERDGDEWIINGQKVWTSGAQFSDVGEIICRTNPDAPKHKGLTGFVVDMHAPGVEVRPLRQMTGGASFNEVFFTDVRVPADHMLGDENSGWTVALTTLMNERASIGGGMGGGGGGGAMSPTRLMEMVRHFGLQDDPLTRQGLAEIFIHSTVNQYTSMRAMAKVKAGQLPGPEMSIGKLALTNNMLRISRFVERTLGPRIAADTGEWGTYSWGKFILGVPGMRLGGGTDEVMHNIIGERVLGLPKDPPPPNPA